MSAVDYSTMSVTELMEQFETTVAELTAIRKALKKAAKVKRAPKVDEDGEPVKRVPSVWAAWSSHAKSTYVAEYEAFVAASEKKQGLVPMFAKAAKEKHAADYLKFEAAYVLEHPPKSSGSVASSKKKPVAVPDTTDDEAVSTKSKGKKKAAGGAGAAAAAETPAPSDTESTKKPTKKKAAPAPAGATSESETEAPKPKAKREAKVPKKVSE
jgi:hypothetical protein